MTKLIRYTEKQIADWRDFERVRQSGAFNMFDPKARKFIGLTRDEYKFSMMNYDGLEKAAHEMFTRGETNHD